MSRPVFSLRKELQSEQSYNGSIEKPFHGEHVLTKNEKYTVYHTPGPSSLSYADVHGYMDPEKPLALAGNGRDVCLWNYNSNAHQEVRISEETAPFCLLTVPVEGESPGLVSVTEYGHVTFHESVDRIITAALLQQDQELYLPLSSKEIVTTVTNVEPAGVLVTTSYGRVLLVSLRDAVGKPQLGYTQLVKSQAGFFSVNSGKQVSGVVVGESAGQQRAIATITKDGDYFQWVLSQGKSRKVTEINILRGITDFVKELYTFDSVSILDMAPLPHLDAYLVLAQLVNNFSGEHYYIQYTIRVSQQGYQVFSAYRFNTYTQAANEASLLVTKTTAFVIFHNAVVLTEIPQKLDHSERLRSRWEDIITLRDDVIIYTSKIEENSALMLSSIGLLKVTREMGESNKSFIQTHIEQAVYSASGIPIEFNIPKEIDLDVNELQHDLLQVASDVITSNSPYLAPASMDKHLESRKAVMEKLLKFTHDNALHISSEAKQRLLANYEIVCCALNWYQLDSKSRDDSFWLHLEGFPFSLSQWCTTPEKIISIFGEILKIEKQMLPYLAIEKHEQPWFVEHKLALLVNEQFQKVEDIYVLEYVSILYYLFSCDQNNQSVYVSNCTQWTARLCIAGYKNEALDMAEAYGDLQSLVQIHETVRFPHYFSKFGYEFACVLYEHYIDTHQLQKLFECNLYLEEFFNDGKHGSVSWIKDIMENNFGKASSTLLGQTGSLEERQFQLSIAKLCAVANDSTFAVAQEQLDFVEAQNDLTETKLILNSIYPGNSILAHSFNKSLEKLENHIVLSLDELVDLYTMSDYNFITPLKLLALSSVPTEERDFLERLIWKRCVNSAKLEDTLRCFFENDLGSLPTHLSLMPHDDLLKAKYGDVPISKLKEELLAELPHDVEAVKMAIGDANAATGNSKVINYDLLFQ